MGCVGGMRVVGGIDLIERIDLIDMIEGMLFDIPRCYRSTPFKRGRLTR